jgi:peptidoglycan hydrolase CwlO-like protein
VTNKALENAIKERENLLKELDILTKECEFYCLKINNLDKLIKEYKQNLKHNKEYRDNINLIFIRENYEN